MREKAGQSLASAFLSVLLWRGQDSNLRPLGYEPNELPLLHPAVFQYCKDTTFNGLRQPPYNKIIVNYC